MLHLLNSPFSSVQGNYFNYRCQVGFLRWIYPPSTRRTSWLSKYIHSVDHVPISKSTLFLIPLILNYLSAAVPICFPQVSCPFQKRNTNIVWSSKHNGFIYWRIWWPNSSIRMKFFCAKMVVCVLWYIRCVLLSMSKDRKISSQ